MVVELMEVFAIGFFLFIFIVFIVCAVVILSVFASIAFGRDSKVSARRKYLDDWYDSTLDYAIVRGDVRLDDR